MQPAPEGLTNSRVEAPSNMVWQRRYFIVLTILGLLAIAGVIIWGIGLVAQPVILFIISAIFAYILYPLVKIFQRVMPRLAAILLALLLVLMIVAFVFLYVMIASVQQLILLVKSLQAYFQHLGQQDRSQGLTELAQMLGIGQGQLHVSGQQVVAYMSHAINGVLPIVGNIFSLFVIGLIVASLSVYLMIDGPRINGWLHRNAPLCYRANVNFFLDTVERTMGGFVRGAMYMGVLITAIVGVGAYIIGVPYLVLLLVIVFICEFIPLVGSWISGFIGILFALTQGWQTALIYAIFVTLVQGGLEGQILAPRVFGRAVGLHPMVSLLALLVGVQLFGMIGALLACPVAGIIQTFISSLWKTWRESHANEFPEEQPLVERHEQPVVRT